MNVFDDRFLKDRNTPRLRTLRVVKNGDDARRRRASQQVNQVAEFERCTSSEPLHCAICELLRAFTSGAGSFFEISTLTLDRLVIIFHLPFRLF